MVTCYTTYFQLSTCFYDNMKLNLKRLSYPYRALLLSSKMKRKICPLNLLKFYLF